MYDEDERLPQTTRDDGAVTLPADVLLVVPVRNIVVFPGMVFPLTVGRERSRAAAYEAARLQRPLGILLQTKAEIEQPEPGDLHWVGRAAHDRHRGFPVVVPMVDGKLQRVKLKASRGILEAGARHGEVRPDDGNRVDRRKRILQ